MIDDKNNSKNLELKLKYYSHKILHSTLNEINIYINK